jgi:hypothetical protein
MNRNEPPQMAANDINFRKFDADMTGSKDHAHDMAALALRVPPLLAVCQSGTRIWRVISHQWTPVRLTLSRSCDKQTVAVV